MMTTTLPNTRFYADDPFISIDDEKLQWLTSADLVKVGPKGYVHGWIKVEPGSLGVPVNDDDVHKHLSEEKAKRFTSLVKDDRLKLPYAERHELESLKNEYTDNMLQSAGFSPGAAHIIGGSGILSAGHQSELENNMLDWLERGQHNASEHYIRHKFTDSTSSQPPEYRESDFSGAKSMQGTPVFDDMSAEAISRRKAVAEYWAPRAQYSYTQAALKAAGIINSVPLARYVHGEYARPILDAAKAKKSWEAGSYSVSSWADSKSSADALKRIRSSAGGNVTVKLSQNVDPRQIYMHWRAEPKLRDPHIILGEVAIANSVINDKTTKVRDATQRL
jgi:hypothetical protein